MRLVVDANILFAAMLKSGTTRKLLVSDTLELFAPEFALLEFEKHSDMLADRVGVTPDVLKEAFRELLLRARIHVLPADEVKKLDVEACHLSPDPDDVPYLASALKLKCPIWSHDKALKKQSLVRIVSTEELVYMTG